MAFTMHIQHYGLTTLWCIVLLYAAMFCEGLGSHIELILRQFYNIVVLF